MRSLAKRSSSAAKEIKALITTSMQTIRDGSTLAGEAGNTMRDVTQAVARVTDIMGEIAAASAGVPVTSDERRVATRIFAHGVHVNAPA
ncbi:hypothetical protein WL02_18500 [Burkholderia ubonensis]|uniref:Methyl-accepting transducer domain-containing protein n=1 Tax=Burkholderia ubonensis TaxID=101571 RepID=A0AAW3MNJ1_9BURK|nr:hypothetical protein WJ96_21460 [Burkholderia ubonensis]KVX16178.1 hypothetical protein WL02_18500 [Burkholderia ubonensis]KWA01755.1 hypothetical protein WL25_03900 [Burkholderia ubonensis]